MFVLIVIMSLMISTQVEVVNVNVSAVVHRDSFSTRGRVVYMHVL
jgi:hypothetical protein